MKFTIPIHPAAFVHFRLSAHSPIANNQKQQTNVENTTYSILFNLSVPKNMTKVKL